MNRYMVFMVLIALCGLLSALEVQHYDGRKWIVDYSELSNRVLVNVETVRDKDGRQLTELWQGLELAKWLDELSGDDWYGIKLETNDSYVVQFSRFELNHNPAYLALKLEGVPLSDYDVRVVVPNYRENKWARNLKSISLVDFSPMYQPWQIRIWDNRFPNVRVHGQEDNGLTIPLQVLMQFAFGQQNAEVLFMDSQMNRLKLRYPEDLFAYHILQQVDMSLSLMPDDKKTANQASAIKMEDIIYLQCGPIAYIRKPAITDIAELGKSLGWDIQDKELKVFTQKSRRYKGGKLKADSWLGW